MPDTVIITKAALEKLKKIHEEMEEIPAAKEVARDLKYWIEDVEGY